MTSMKIGLQVWVVTGQQGSYSDYSKWVVGVAFEIPEAIELAKKDMKKGHFSQPDIHVPIEIISGQTQLHIGTIQQDYDEEVYDEVDYYAEAYTLYI